MTVRILRTREDVILFSNMQKERGYTLGFVPTMGALHEGHATLLRQAAQENDVCVLSIFVNPKQFGPKEDFSKYPRTFDDDLALAESCGCSAVFFPTPETMYPVGFRTAVRVNELDTVLCGAYRPGHFDGVCTVVLLLLNLVGANRAYFGMKDFQQLCIVQRLCADLNHSTQVVAVPTFRESDGLAMSSRNRYLSVVARAQAAAIPRALSAAAQGFLSGVRQSSELIDSARAVLKAVGLEPQYLEIRAVDDILMQPAQVEAPSVLAVAQFVESEGGQVRLIDNIVLAPDAFYKKLLMELILKTKGS